LGKKSMVSKATKTYLFLVNILSKELPLNFKNIEEEILSIYSIRVNNTL
tara:strand:+ start:89 stop:235 length:147 start_codon:yes stop_codon:yes gene_type:complete